MNFYLFKKYIHAPGIENLCVTDATMTGLNICAHTANNKSTFISFKTQLNPKNTMKEYPKQMHKLITPYKND